MCICDLKIGEIGTVMSICGDDKLTKRLLALGCVEGTEVFVKRFAPLGDPIVINFRGFDMAIRKTDAKKIYINNLI
ncbi:ferrous iron transport protein A [Clostridium putrefaciens]|uniref:Ferrous iron transport protein A n=1 Tax=Clostridium putrefaciens TaxID=99675 RepID=A0A381J829_9CLOT|nr:FeoA family protein [Clostridium putrefaciens]SUY46848.1 ferrous iron transport protein A [Clostridium putrefaciens]